MNSILFHVLSTYDLADKNWRKTLRNPMLRAKLDRLLYRLNGDYYDPTIVDTSLEYYEALADIGRRHPDIRTYESEDEIPP